MAGDGSMTAAASQTQGGHNAAADADLSAAQDDASLSFTGLHAISTMLNHPRKRAAPIHASSARFPPIGPAGHAPPTMPPTDMRVLNDYVTQFSGEWDRYEREHALIRAHNTPTDVAPKRLPPLSTVPQVFFSSDFDLGQPYTFDLVTERYKQSTAMGVESDDNTMQYGVVLNHMLQEKLSYYSDVIEQHLIVEIGAKSVYFFDALATLRQLRTDAQSCLDRTESVARKLDAVDAFVRDGLSIAKLQAERRYLEAQKHLLNQVQTLLERRDLVRLSVQHGEYENAMKLLEGLFKTLDDKEAPLHRLKSLQSLRPQLEVEQAKMAESLRHVLLGMLERAHLTEEAWESIDLSIVETSFASLSSSATSPAPSTCPSIHDVLPSKPEKNAPSSIPLPADLLPMWSLLQRCHGLEQGLRMYTQHMEDLLVQGVRQVVSPYKFAAWAMPGKASAASQDSATSHTWPEHLHALAAILRALWLFAQRMQAVHEILKMHASATEQQILQEATQIVWTSTENTVVALVSPRAPRLPDLDLNAFVVYFSLVWRFMSLIESAAARPGVSLRSCMLSQAKAFLGQFHRVRIERAVRAVEDEVWAPSTISTELQQTVDMLEESASKDVSAYQVELNLRGSAPTGSAASDKAPEVPAQSQESESHKLLQLGNDRFFVVRASGTVILLLSEYVRLVVNLPMFVAEALGWVVEFLKQFNSRTCQVVLGAGAMRSAGLKNITARHLAIAAQTLSLMMALIPSLRGLMKRYLKTTQIVLLSDFDKLQRDFREHQFEIHAKLVSIMGDRVQVHSKALAQLDVHKCDSHLQPMQDLVRETGTLHRVMTQYLQTSVVQAISARVFADIDVRMAHAISAMDVRSSEAQKLIVSEVEHLNEKMQSIDSTWRGDKLTEAAKAKKPRLSLDARRNATPPLAYRARKSLGKRPPATQSPQLESIEAFQGPAPSTESSGSGSGPISHEAMPSVTEAVAGPPATTESITSTSASVTPATAAADVSPPAPSEKPMPPLPDKPIEQPKGREEASRSLSDSTLPVSRGEVPPLGAIQLKSAEVNKPDEARQGQSLPPETTAGPASSASGSDNDRLAPPPEHMPTEHLDAEQEAASRRVSVSAPVELDSSTTENTRDAKNPTDKGAAGDSEPKLADPSQSASTPVKPIGAKDASKDTSASPAQDTPRSKGRVSLEQRLAEAAKRRGLQRAQVQTQVQPQARYQTPDKLTLSQTQQRPSSPAPSTPMRTKPSLAERLAGVTKQDARPTEEPQPRTPSETRTKMGWEANALSDHDTSSVVAESHPKSGEALSQDPTTEQAADRSLEPDKEDKVSPALTTEPKEELISPEILQDKPETRGKYEARNVDDEQEKGMPSEQPTSEPLPNTSDVSTTTPDENTGTKTEELSEDAKRLNQSTETAKPVVQRDELLGSSGPTDESSDLVDRDAPNESIDTSHLIHADDSPVHDKQLTQSKTDKALKAPDTVASDPAEAESFAAQTDNRKPNGSCAEKHAQLFVPNDSALPADDADSPEPLMKREPVAEAPSADTQGSLHTSKTETAASEETPPAESPDTPPQDVKSTDAADSTPEATAPATEPIVESVKSLESSTEAKEETETTT